MVQRSSIGRERQLRQFGEHIRAWRKLQGLSASELARRAYITRETLSNIEQGTGTPRLDSIFSVINSLGFMEHFLAGADPLTTEAGRALAYEK